MQPLISLSEAINDVTLLGGPFQPTSFWTWRVVAKLLDGVRLTEPREIALFEACTGRLYCRQSDRAVRRLILLCGRRAGKDRFLSACAVWRAALAQNWNAHISAGEGAVVLLLGADKKQAAILRRYCHGLLQTARMAAEVTRLTDEVIEFRSGGSLEIITNNAGLCRGRSAIGVYGSECCQWKTGELNASSDEEVVAAAEPSMAMCPDNGPDDPGGLLILGSSVYRRRGYMYRRFKELHGNNDTNDICWFATSQTMNPRLSQAVVDAAMASDRLKASAEYLNIWREDVSDFVPLDVVEDNTDFDTYEWPPQPGIQYWAYFDGATGVPGGASFTMAVTHRRGDDVVHDVIRERKPRFVARDVIAEFAQTLKSYNISEIAGDQFAHQLFADEWQRNGVRAIEGEFDTSENYRRLLMMLMGRRVKMLNSATLRTQLTSLERHMLPSGHEVIRKPQIQSSHDDVATSVAGALVRAGSKRSLFGPDALWLNDGPGVDAQPSDTQNQTYAELMAQRAAPPSNTAGSEAENRAWRQSQYFRQVLGLNSGSTRQINWLALPRQMTWR